jgi:hypothetical protein
MPRTRDDDNWIASGANTYHIDKRRIKLAKVFDTGHVEFKPILEKIIKEIEEREGGNDLLSGSVQLHPRGLP